MSVQEDPQSDRAYKLGSLQFGEGVMEGRGLMTASMRKVSEITGVEEQVLSVFRYYLGNRTHR
jgi:hypothetical protein